MLLGSVPVVDEDVEITVLVEIAKQATHRSHRGWIVGKRRGTQAERLEGCNRARHRRDNDHVCACVDITEVVRQSVAIKIAQAAAAPTEEIQAAMPFAWMNFANLLCWMAWPLTIAPTIVVARSENAPRVRRAQS